MTTARDTLRPLTSLEVPQGVIDSRRHGREFAGSAPALAEVRKARTQLAIALSVMGAISALLITLVVMRVFELALPIGYGPVFAAILAVLVGASFLAAMVYIVYRHSRGTLLGHDLRVTSDAVEQIEAEDQLLLDDANAKLRSALDEAADAQLFLDRADDALTGRVALALEGVRTAVAVLGVEDTPMPSSEKLLDTTRKVRSTAETHLREAGNKAAELSKKLAVRTLPTITKPMDAHALLAAPYLGTVDRSEVEGDAGGSQVSDSPVRRWVMPLVIATVILAIVAAVAAIVLGPLAAAEAAPEAAPAQPSDPVDTELTEGVDYSFIAEVGGQPVRWSCDVPIGVSFDGEVPRGADVVLADAVALVIEASGLPLVVGNPGGVVVRYVDNLDGEGDSVAGTSRPVWNSTTGEITEASVAIDEGDRINRADDPRAVLVMAHELAHAVGLGHATEASELMAPTIAHDVTDFSDGDRFALAAVGCL